jgi:DNA-binding CsgD family transcriptional regulator
VVRIHPGQSTLRHFVAASIRAGCEHVFVQQRVKSLLEAGHSRKSIARQLEIHVSTVTRHARLLGYPDVTCRESRFDWEAIQRYYDDGHTIDECKERFGVSYGAWDKAVTRGDLVTRPRSDGQLALKTQDRVESLLAGGLRPAEIARELGLTKSTVAFHCRRLGHRADPRFARRYEWSKVQLAIDREGLSRGACMKRFGFSADTWSRAVDRGDVVPRRTTIPIEQLLVVGRKGTNRTHLKGRLIADGLKENRCEVCGITEWLGKPLNMELHHVNGDGEDNRLENLQLLCGNCHAQTDNWGGRGQRRDGGPRARQAC